MTFSMRNGSICLLNDAIGVGVTLQKVQHGNAFDQYHLISCERLHCMRVEKQVLTEKSIIPLIAALPYEIHCEAEQSSAGERVYDPRSQRTIYAGNRDYSTSREEESAGGLFSSKSDTKKDD